MDVTTLIVNTDGASARLRTGSVLKRLGETVTGAAALGLAAAAIAWVVLAAAVGRAGPARFVGVHVMPVLLGLVAVGYFVAAVGRERIREAEPLMLRIDENGLAWTGQAPRSLPWEQIRFVVLGRARLWVGGPEAQRVPRKENPEWANYLHRVLSSDRLALDAPLHALDHPRAEIERAIRAASRGRFPGTMESWR